MALENKKESDFSQWYTEVILKSEAADYAPIQGCIVFRELSYAVWEKIQDELNAKIKASGHKNVYFPLFIPKKLLEQEATHVEGFTPEVAWVTLGGSTELEEPLAIRPTSETIMYHMYSKWVHSHRDLPLLLNQWCSVVRWETKATKPFLRTREFLWQEGHTVHCTEKQADEEVRLILGYYKDLIENTLAIPVFTGLKSENEKFPGALYTTTLEAIMPDGKALQCGTSHNLGQNFSKAFNIKFKDEKEQDAYAWQTSWGVSTRLLGALIMVHGDDKGLVLPPKVAPVQVVIVPIVKSGSADNEKIFAKAGEYADALKKLGVSVKVDDRDDKSPGWKYAEWELKGVPVRMELGARDLQNEGAVLVRRDNGEKAFVKAGELSSAVPALLDLIQKSLFEKAKTFRDEHVSEAKNFDEFKSVLNGKKGFVRASWCGEVSCEESINAETSATVRVISFEEQKLVGGACVKCGKPSLKNALFAKSY